MGISNVNRLTTPVRQSLYWLQLRSSATGITSQITRFLRCLVNSHGTIDEQYVNKKLNIAEDLKTLHFLIKTEY